MPKQRDKDEVLEAEIVKPETPPENIKGDDCSVCRFYFPESESEDGYCHRRAPHCTMSGHMVDDGIDTVWPCVEATDWCGEGERIDGAKF